MNFLTKAARRISLALAASIFAFAGTQGSPAAAGELRVVASIKPVHSLVSSVMAGAGTPYLAIRGKASPHTFAIRPSDASATAEADVVFLIDGALETALADVIESLATKAHVIPLADAEGLIRRRLREGGAFEVDDHDHDHDHDHEEEHAEADMDGHDHSAFDMHIWLDPLNAKAMVRTIAATLSGADPGNAASYEANARAVLDRLDMLTEWIAAEIATARGKPFIVFHDGYRYFEDRFGLNAVGSVVVNAERSPGVGLIRELRGKMRELGVVCVFAEPQFNNRVVNVILEETQVRSGILDPLGAAVKDGPELYFTLLRNMTASFRNCLAPAG